MTSEKAFLTFNFEFVLNPLHLTFQSISKNPINPRVYLEARQKTPSIDDYGDEKVIKVYASGLSPGNFLIEASLTSLNKKMQKDKTPITSETMELFSFISSKKRMIDQKVNVTTSIYVKELPKPVQMPEKIDCADCKEFKILNGKVLDDSPFSDFKFTIKDKEFKVHRAVLVAASPVFAKLFTVDMEEAKHNECIVKDIEPEIFEHLLRFIYKREVPANLTEVAMKLFEAAHYYETEELKEMCLQKVFELIKASNAVQIFNWACLYDCEELKKKAWIIIKQDILKTTEPLQNKPPAPEQLLKLIELWTQIFNNNLDKN